MGCRYRQLSLDDRCEIARLQANGCSIRQIAAAVDRPPSTIARELKRNSGGEVGYKPTYAQQQTQARRWVGSRLERDAGLRDAVLKRLQQGWSPEQVAGRLAREGGASASATRASTASFTRRLPAPRITHGVIICRAPKANAASGAEKAAALRASSRAGLPCPNARPMPTIALHRVTGRQTSCCLPATAKPS